MIGLDNTSIIMGLFSDRSFDMKDIPHREVAETISDRSIVGWEPYHISPWGARL